MHSRFAATLLTLLLAVATSAPARGRAGRDEITAPAQFDYYLMALSWSPSFCATHPQDSEQCGRRGFGFVLHGLWPQNRNGSWPQHCRSADTPDEATIVRTLAFMPSRQLIEHEWQTHGSCSGLDAQAYFELADRAFAVVRIPPALNTPQSAPSLSAADVAQAFMQVNPQLSDAMISVDCHGGSDLSEVRICLDKSDLTPVACGGRMRNTCHAGTLHIPTIR